MEGGAWGGGAGLGARGGAGDVVLRGPGRLHQPGGVCKRQEVW